MIESVKNVGPVSDSINREDGSVECHSLPAPAPLTRRSVAADGRWLTLALTRVSGCMTSVHAVGSCQFLHQRIFILGLRLKVVLNSVVRLLSLLFLVRRTGSSWTL